MHGIAPVTICAWMIKAASLLGVPASSRERQLRHLLRLLG